jgi:hypothetical protein
MGFVAQLEKPAAHRIRSALQGMFAAQVLDITASHLKQTVKDANQIHSALLETAKTLFAVMLEKPAAFLIRSAHLLVLVINV